MQSTFYSNYVVDLNKMAMDIPDSNYESRNFPGLVFNGIKGTGTNITVFEQGKVVITGAKTQQEMVETVRIAAPVLAHFKVADLPEKSRVNNMSAAMKEQQSEKKKVVEEKTAFKLPRFVSKNATWQHMPRFTNLAVLNIDLTCKKINNKRPGADMCKHYVKAKVSKTSEWEPVGMLTSPQIHMLCQLNGAATPEHHRPLFVDCEADGDAAPPTEAFDPILRRLKKKRKAEVPEDANKKVKT